jgi:hypothetical protein
MLFLKKRNVSKKLKQLVIYVIAGCFIFIACKAKQANTAPTPPPITDDSSNSLLKAKGFVTHQYKPQGCETIIVCALTNADTLFLIPATPLQEFDVDGLKISFSYHMVRIHNPKGCHKGIPAQITNIKKQ